MMTNDSGQTVVQSPTGGAENGEKRSLNLAPVQMRTGGGPGPYLRKVWAVAMKDIRAEVRAKEVLSTMVAFGVLAVVIFSLAFDVRVPNMAMVAPGVLWAVVLFAGVLGLHRSFGAEINGAVWPPCSWPRSIAAPSTLASSWPISSSC